MKFDTAIDKMLDAAAADYDGRWGDGAVFRKNLRPDGGRKYLRIISDHNGGARVWGFVVKEDGPKFKKGDILKAASWKAPATNSARGNIFDEEYEVKWTGPLYL